MNPPDPDPPHTPGDPRLRIRMWVGGALADEEWIDARDPDRIARVDAAQARHLALAEQAERDGLPWMAEAFDPAKPPHRAYTRFGSDPGAAFAPAPMRPPQP